jgi:hypothetical protein
MKPETILNTLKRTGPLKIDDLFAAIHRRHKDVSEDELVDMLEKLRDQGLTKCSPLGKWLASASPEVSAADAGIADSGHRTRALIYSPQIIADTPKFERNTFLHFIASENGGFRLRDYTRGKRIEVDRVAGITKTSELQKAYEWTLREFNEEEAATALTDNEFWSKRLQAANRSFRTLLKEHDAEAIGE